MVLSKASSNYSALVIVCQAYTVTVGHAKKVVAIIHDA